MTAENKINALLDMLDTVQEGLLSLPDDMLLSIDPRDNESLDEGAQFIKEYNDNLRLFGAKPERIDLLNEVAPAFFRIVQDALWETTILHISRLTDPAESCKKKNLTIQQLPKLVQDPKASKEISELVDIAVERADFCRDWRNRRIAHSDLKLAIEDGIEPLKTANRKKVREVLDAIVEVLNAVTRHYMNSTTMLIFSDSPDGAICLLQALTYGQRFKQERIDRLNRGEYQEEDLILDQIESAI